MNEVMLAFAFPLVFGGGFLAGGIYFLVTSISKRGRRTAQAQGIIAEVVQHSGLDVGSQLNTISYPVLRFCDGQGHQIETQQLVSSSLSDYEPGSQVVVEYDPHDPQGNAVIAGDGNVGIVLGGILTGIGVAVWVISAIIVSLIVMGD